jgi:type VI secretion system secreted protein Hcp
MASKGWESARFQRRAAWLTTAALIAVAAVGLRGWSMTASGVGPAQAANGTGAPVESIQVVSPGETGPDAAGAAVDYYLKIDGVDGDSTDRGLEGAIEIESWSWGATQGASAHGAGGGGGAGKVVMQDFHFTMKTGKASPQLFLLCATGQHIKQATLTARKAGGTQETFLTVKLSDVLISSYQTGASSGDVVPTDQVSLNFTKIEYAVRPVMPDGSLGPPVSATYDVQTGHGS